MGRPLLIFQFCFSWLARPGDAQRDDRNAADQAVDADGVGRLFRHDPREQAGEALKKAKEAAEELGDKIAESPITKKAADTAEKVGAVVLDKGGKAIDKAADLAEEVGEQVLDKGGKLLERLKDTAEDVGGKIIKKSEELYDKAQKAAAEEQAGDDLVDQADKATADSGAQLDDLMEKAKKMAEEPPAKPKSKLEDSLLDEKDDFWAKAQRYSEGDYHNEGARKKDGEISITNAEPAEKPKNEGKVKGFEDLDGDGDEIIDDAIVVDDDDD